MQVKSFQTEIFLSLQVIWAISFRWSWPTGRQTSISSNFRVWVVVVSVLKWCCHRTICRSGQGILALGDERDKPLLFHQRRQASHFHPVLSQQCKFPACTNDSRCWGTPGAGQLRIRGIHPSRLLWILWMWYCGNVVDVVAVDVVVVDVVMSL